MTSRSVSSLRYACVAAATLCGMLGCSNMRATGSPAPTAAPSAASQPTLQQVAELHAKRASEQTQGDYVLGEGDVLSVNAFDFQDLNQRVRVDGNGAITLPLLNAVPVAGHTVAEVQRDLTQRLGAFMYDPHISVFVEEYHSQQVAVVGAVQKPGLVSQMIRGNTVLDALTAAGGPTIEAGNRIYFIPAENRTHPGVQVLASGVGGGAGGAISASDVEKLGDATLMIDTKEASEDAQRFFFTLPVRPGDVIVVPRAGTFYAQGWLAKPGSYPVQTGLTLRGAIAAAGGLQFPARTSCIRIYGTNQNGHSDIREVNYDDITNMKMPDVFIHDGDVVEVAYSTVKLVPWAAWQGITDIFRIGARVTTGL
jgi:polysaccharide export outer membrane protein